MSQEIDLCEDSDANGEWPNTASAPSPPLSRKRLRDNEGSSKDAHPRNENGPVNKTATDSAEFVVDLELADELEVSVSPHEKRRGVTENEWSAKNDAAGKCLQIMKGVDATEKDVCSVDAQVADHRESHEGLTAAASHPMNSDSEQTSPKLPSRHLTISVWEDRLSELADYRKIHGHCNVPQKYREITQLGKWVATQRRQHKLHREGKPSTMTLSRIQELESLGFEWKVYLTAWEDRLSELADYRKIHGHCNVRKMNSENTQLGKWVGVQRYLYRLFQEGKRSKMTFLRIQALESLGLEWKAPKTPSLDDDAMRVRERAVESPEHMQKISAVAKSTAIKSTSVSNPKDPTGMAKSIKRVEAGEAAKSSRHSDRLAAKSLSPDKSALVGDSLESNNRKDALQVDQQKILNSFSKALLVARPPENDFIVAAKKPANSRQGTESQLETAPSNKILRASPVVAEPLQQRHNIFTHALLLGDGSTGNGAQATPDKPANAQLGAQHTPPDEVFQSDNVLNGVELELVWLGEESMYCLSCPEFQFDFIYEYASPALKVELRKLSRDDQSEAEKQKQIVRMKDWLVSRRFDFVRKDIRKKLVRGFRRQRMRIVIAELRLLRREQSERHFPAMLLGRTETAPVKASTVIEQVDVNTLKVVATFPSQIEAERQTGISRSDISRGLRQGRPLDGYFWRSVRL
jgi:hypothetical protein